jgi:hypothetical protein
MTKKDVELRQRQVEEERKRSLMDKPYDVEKGIPIPIINRTTRHLYPFEKMEIGDSFAVPVILEEPHHKKFNKLNSAICAWRRKNKCPEKKFTCRFIKEESIIRCWRVV